MALPLGGFLLLLHFFITLSFTFFLHTHTLENGEKVVHSHPFGATDSEGEPLHRHPGSVYQLVPDFEHYLETSPGVAEALLPFNRMLYPDTRHRLCAVQVELPGLRGPPLSA